MTRAAIAAIALLAVIGSARADESAPAAASPPYRSVRKLQALQDRIAYGSLDAHNQQSGLLKRLGEDLLQADPEVWKDPRNARAAVTFLLSGGDPKVIRDLRAKNLLGLDPAILDGALAYVEGRPDDARPLLGGVDAHALPDTLAAEITLAQSALLARSDVESTIKRLDQVRLAMPGTLIEEAALRREIFLVGQADDFDKFESLASQYFRRFRHSIYAGNFRQRFALSVARFSFAQQADRFWRLAAVLDHLDRASQRALYVLITRTALIRGKTEMATLAAERLIRLTEEQSPERARADFFRATARLVSGDYEQALRDLQQFDRNRLPGADAELLTAALELGRNMRKPAALIAGPLEVAGDGDSAVRSRIEFGSSSDALDRAQKLLDQDRPPSEEGKP
ncbi:chemotaxis protein [Rhodopseudomonas sp. NSM]|uniref:chemotaxis protein n=1 Tax=Rhodopseudomonas sp. NSM TaxID=3457630 RepID=UPI004035E199